MGEGIKKQQSLKLNTLVYGVGNLSIFAIKFFLVPLYTFYLSEGALGWFDVVAATVPMVAVVLGGHVELALLRWMLEKPSRLVQNQVFTNSVVLNLLGLSLFSLLYFVVIHFNWIDLEDYTTPLILFFYVVSVWLYTFVKQSIRSMFSAKMFVATDIFFTLIFLAQVIAYVIFMDMKISGILLAYSISNAVVFFYWIGIRKMYQYFSLETLNYAFIKELLRYSLPLVPNTLNLWSINTVVKYMILFYLGFRFNGIFAIAFKIGFVIQMINGIFNKAWQDKAISSYNETGFKDTINPIFQKYFIIFSCMTLGLIAAQWIIVENLIEESFHEATNYIWFIAVGFFFMGLANFISVIYQCEKNTVAITISSVVANVVLIVFAFLLINRLVLYGAAIAFALGNLSLFLYRFFHVKRYINLQLDIKFGLIFLISLISVLYLSLFFIPPYGAYIAIGLVGIFTLVFNKEDIQKVLLAVRKKIGNS